MQAPEERLGSFYLGAEYDLASAQRRDKPVHYDARDLTTHAVCVGMTGSGKTGLCIGLLEEAALDRIPVIIVDPKGDMTNLLLQFPDLLPENFRPWINEDDARRKGKSVDELAAVTAEQWKNGLADWGIVPERIRQLQESADYTIYTPGSDAGIPVNILGSLSSPGLDFKEHAETIRERITGTVSALLGLAGIGADPVKSRESILLSGIFEHFWKRGENLDIALLITSIQNPPMRKVGVFDVDTFYPEKERFALAMAFNNLIASPSFQSWLSGDPLDIGNMLHTTSGKPRHSIFYLAHLSENERMFFVTLLLENLLTWVRRQPGTSSLRALLYFDEVFGYLPPVAEPSSKRPLLTLLKQARAFGLGCLLVTQNPVDLDYKGLTNTGTWFIGKLQAERDKQRVLEGLKSAIATAGGAGDSVDYDAIISQLGNRVFLLHNVHEDRPVLFQTRWVMSFLSGPLTRPQIKQLMDPKKSLIQPAPTPMPPAVTEGASVSQTRQADSDIPDGFSTTLPGLEPTMKQLFVPVKLDARAALEHHARHTGTMPGVSKEQLVYEPVMVGSATVAFSQRSRGINETCQLLLACFEGCDSGNPCWEKSERLRASQESLAASPDRRATAFAALPETLSTSRKLSAFRQSLVDWLYYHFRYRVSVHPETGLFRNNGESDRDFSIRLQQAAREKRDGEVDALERKFAPQLERIRERIQKEERKLVKNESEHQSRKATELVGMGESLLGFFLGRRSTRSMGSALNRRRMTARAKADVEESLESLDEMRQKQQQLTMEIQEQAKKISEKWEHPESSLVTEEVAPRRSEVNVHFIALGWLPFWRLTINSDKEPATLTLPAYALQDEPS